MGRTKGYVDLSGLTRAVADAGSRYHCVFLFVSADADYQIREHDVERARASSAPSRLLTAETAKPGKDWQK
jgi:hypothetical protein